MNRIFILLSGVLFATYPLLVLFGLKILPVYYLGLFFIVLAIVRLWFLRATGQKGQIIPVVLCAILVLVALYAALSGQPLWFRFYPVAVNVTLLGVFLSSLWHGAPIVERLARVAQPDLPTEAIPYTRKVTVLWCCFFVANGFIALCTALWASFEAWAWYNGLVAYCLMAVLFAGEWLVRKRVQRNANA